MKKIEVTEIMNALEEQDEKLIKVCLDYCYHRIYRHEHCGIKNLIDLKQLNKLRKEL